MSNQPQWLDTPDNADPYLRFWIELLRTSSSDKGQQEPLRQFCAQHLDYLNLNLIPVIQTWFRQNLPPSAQRDTLVGLVENVVIDIKNFPLGKRADNLEIAIAGYLLVLEARPRATHAEKWAQTQNNLGEAYRIRIRGERADNIELAIAAYTLALQVRTREAFPEKWAMTQNNLANAYSDRIRG
ncbi:MAG: hypothetical protein ACO3EZ_18805, partial [Prochlorotrichaceae cyanobacterium]